MLINHRWQSKTALLMALGIISTGIIPIVTAAPATAGVDSLSIAQIFRGPRPNTIPNREIDDTTITAGNEIPVRYDEAERIIVTPDETAPVTLTVAGNIRSASGRLLIPAGSTIEGELRPTEDGTQFVAESLILRGSDQSLPIDATSEIITNTETISEESGPDILKGAAIGAAAAAVIAEIFGGIDIVEVLGGAGLGTIASLLLRGSEEVEVVVIEPDTDLDLTIESPLELY